MKTFLEELTDKVSLQEEVLPRITFFYPRAIIVEGHKGVLEYSLESILFRVGKENFCIKGNDLNIVEITKDEFFVRGKVQSVEKVDE